MRNRRTKAAEKPRNRELGPRPASGASRRRGSVHLVAKGCAAALALLTSAGAQAQLLPPRHYADASEYRYHLLQEETRGGVSTSLDGVVAIKVERRPNGDYAETIRWVRLGESGSPDDAAARALPAYHLSLAPGGTIESPRPKGSVALLGMVTDLQTFYAAISPGLGAGDIKDVGRPVERQEPVIGDFSDGDVILSGKDCTIARLTVTAIERDHVVLETRFDPPARSCLSGPAATDGGVPRNFEMIRKVGAFFISLVGTEQFTIVSRVSRRDGQLLEADMINRLDLEGRRCTDAALTDCSPTPPVSRVRKVRLKLSAVEPLDAK